MKTPERMTLLRRVSLGGLTCLIILAGGTTLAGTEVLSAPVKTAEQRGMQEKQGRVQVAPSSNLRCWQEGKLLFEETEVNGRNLEQMREIIVFDQTPAARQDGALFLIESGSATCLYKQA